MPKLTNPLSEIQIRKAKPKEKLYKLNDREGLRLVVYPSGRKTWILEFTIPNSKKRKSITLGYYPAMSLKEAREERNKIKSDLKRGITPDFIKRKMENNLLTLEEIANEYLNLQTDLSKKYIKDNLGKLKNHIFPFFNGRNINDIKPLEIIEILKKIDNAGKNETAKRIYSLLNRIFRYGVTIGKVERNIIADIDVSIILRKVKPKNFKHTINPKELSQVLKSIDEYFGDISTKRALQILPYVFVRPSNLRFMEWEELDLENKLWIIPADKMKTKKEFIVPLYDFVIEIINQQKEYPKAKYSKYVFPSQVTNVKPLSENTLNFALKRIGLDITAHGFRHTASTLLHENIYKHNIPSIVIETQLAHSVGNSVHRVYNKAEYLPQRIELMNWWGKYLDELKNKNND